MTFVVTFDGSPLSAAALARAVEYSCLTDEPVVAVAAIPASARYAREQGWVDEIDSFDVEVVAARLREQVADLAPDATFRYERIGSSAPGAIASTLRAIARDEAASVVFIGSENAGRLVIPITSVGGAVAADDHYDVHVVRRHAPSPIAAIDSKPERYRRSLE